MKKTTPKPIIKKKPSKSPMIKSMSAKSYDTLPPTPQPTDSTPAPSQTKKIQPTHPSQYTVNFWIRLIGGAILVIVGIVLAIAGVINLNASMGIIGLAIIAAGIVLLYLLRESIHSTENKHLVKK